MAAWRSCWFPGHDYSCGPVFVAGQFGSKGMADAVVTGLPNCNVVSQVMAGAVGSGACGWPCWFPGHGVSCGPGAATSLLGSWAMVGAVVSGSA